MKDDRNDELFELLCGVRAHLEDATIRGMQAVPDEALSSAGPARQPVDAPAAADWFAVAAAAREAGVDNATALARVREDLGDCHRCPLHHERRNLVFGVGDPEADLVVVGEAPGYHEDQQGEPFVGPAGQMLDKMLTHVLGLERNQVYILNVVKCRPPKNRNPEPDELEACRPFLDAQLVALQPKVLLVLGSVAYKALFRTDEGIKRNRGTWHDHSGVPTMPTFHPAYLLRSPEDKRLTFADLKAARDRYDALGGRRP